MPIILITPPTSILSELSLVNDMFDRGLHRLHLRKPGLSRQEHIAYIKGINPMYHNRIALHDFHDLTLQFTALSVHFREREIPSSAEITRLKSTLKPGTAISVGYHKPEDLLIDRGPVDYCFLSPIFESISKQGYRPPSELHLENHDQLKVKYITQSRYPVVALGGLEPSKFAHTADIGFSGAALLGSVWYSKDPLAALEAALEKDASTELSWPPFPRWSSFFS